MVRITKMITAKVQITPRNQCRTTIPSPVASSMGLSNGDRILFDICEGGIAIICKHIGEDGKEEKKEEETG